MGFGFYLLLYLFVKSTWLAETFKEITRFVYSNASVSNGIFNFVSQMQISLL